MRITFFDVMFEFIGTENSYYNYINSCKSLNILKMDKCLSLALSVNLHQKGCRHGANYFGK